MSTLFIESSNVSVSVLRPEGELDCASGVGLESALLGRLHTYHAVIVDLEAVSFVDCAGLGVLLAVDRRARRTGRRMLLANPPPAVARLLELTGYGPILDTRPSLAEALDSVGRGGTVPLE